MRSQIHNTNHTSSNIHAAHQLHVWTMHELSKAQTFPRTARTFTQLNSLLAGDGSYDAVCGRRSISINTETETDTDISISCSCRASSKTEVAVDVNVDGVRLCGLDGKHYAYVSDANYYSDYNYYNAGNVPNDCTALLS